MGKRLPPGEAERRAAERHRATFSGEKYLRYNPEVEGYGSYAEWAGAAAAFINGDTIFEIEDSSAARPGTNGPKPAEKAKKRNSNPYLAILDLDEMPINLAGLNKGYRAAVMAAFRAANSSDTSPDYVNAFKKITVGFETIKRQKGW